MSAFERQMQRKKERESRKSAPSIGAGHNRYDMQSWTVTCGGNHHMVTHMWSPLKPGFCPVCGRAAASVAPCKQVESAPRPESK